MVLGFLRAYELMQPKERVEEIRQQDKVDEIKQAEVRRSKEMFGGFDIYGSKKRPTSTLNHLT